MFSPFSPTTGRPLAELTVSHTHTYRAEPTSPRFASRSGTTPASREIKTSLLARAYLRFRSELP